MILDGKRNSRGHGLEGHSWYILAKSILHVLRFLSKVEFKTKKLIILVKEFFFKCLNDIYLCVCM